MHRMAAPGKRHRHGGGNGGLADAALAHQHDQTVTVPGDLIDKAGKGRRGDLRQRRDGGRRAAALGQQQAAQGIEADQVERHQRDPVLGQ